MTAELLQCAGFERNGINIFVDSQAAKKALISFSMKSAVVTLRMEVIPVLLIGARPHGH